MVLCRESGGVGQDAVGPTDAVAYPKGRAVAVRRVRNREGLRGPFVRGVLDQPRRTRRGVVGIVEGQTEVGTDGRNKSVVVRGLPSLSQ